MSEAPLGVHAELKVETEVRDGTILRSTLARPDTSEPVPGILIRSPYGTAKPQDLMAFARAGYAIMAQDSRGRHTSDGTHINFKTADNHEGEDGYDTVEWMAAQPWCNGNVGMMGSSYGGYMTWETARRQPPHLVATAATTIPPDLHDVDFTQGSFRPARRVHWWMTAIAPDMRRRQGGPEPHTMPDAKAQWKQEQARWLGFMPWCELPDFLPEPLASQAREWLHDPGQSIWRLDEYWQDIQVPNLDVSGWYDHCNGSIKHLPGMQNHGGSELARAQARLVLGPWNHTTRGQQKTGEIDYGPIAAMDLTSLYIRWFDHWLKDLPNEVPQWPSVQYFVMGEDKWSSSSTWPPPEATPQHWYLSGDDGLATEPEDESRSTSYTYDPRDPVPTLWTPDLFTVPADCRQLDHRQDILRFTSQPLAKPLTIAGYPEARFFAASSALDTDFFVRLIDVEPEGMARDLCHGMVRARHRHGLDQEDLLEPGDVTEFQLRLGAIAHCFRPGHRLRVDITSSDFPNYDRNHNTGGNDLFETTLKRAHQAIFWGADQPSQLTLPVI